MLFCFGVYFTVIMYKDIEFITSIFEIHDQESVQSQFMARVGQSPIADFLPDWVTLWI